MEDKAIRGVPWTVLSYAGTRVIYLATTVALAHLVAPSDVGLIALATLAIGGLTIFSDVGLGSVFVLRQDLDEREQGTVYTIMLVLSAVGAVLIVALAPLVGDFFDEERLPEVLRALAVLQLLGGVTWFHDTMLQRELEFSRRFACRIAESAVYAAVSITLAALGQGVWSLVAGLIAGWVTFTVMLLALAPYRVRPVFDAATARDLARTGWGFMVQSAISFLKYNADYAAVGRYLSAAQVGFYTMAYRLGEQTYWAIADPLSKVTFPAFARMRDRGEDIRPSFLSAYRAVALAACPLGVLMSGAAAPLVLAVFGERWEPMIGPLAVLGIWAAVRPLQSTVEWLLNSLGRAGPLATISTVLFALQVPALFIAADRSGIVAVAWVMVAHAAVSVLVLSLYTAPAAEIPLARQLRAVWPVLLASAGAWLASRGAANLTEGEWAGASLALSLAAGGAVYAGVVWLVDRSLLRSVAAQLRRALGRTATPS